MCAERITVGVVGVGKLGSIHARVFSEDKRVGSLFLYDMVREKAEKAASIYRTIGVYFGYAVAHYAHFYEIKNLLILGRVTSGEGGEIILSTAREVLEKEFPDLSEKITFRTPDEKSKRHGQAVAAASLPSIKKD